MKKIILTICTVWLAIVVVQAQQQHVLNSSLESGSVVTNNGQIQNATNWHQMDHCNQNINWIGGSSADLLDCNNAGTNLSVPNNQWVTNPLPERTGGCRYGHLHSSLQEIVVFSFFQEYAAATMNEPLQQGCYTVSIWVAKGDVFYSTPDNVSPDNILEIDLIQTRNSNSCSLPTKHILTTGHISNTNWVQVTANFTITAAEAGLFQFVKLTAPTSYFVDHQSDILFDDLEITDASAPTVSVTGSQSTICEGESTTLTASGYSNYTWTPSTGLNTTTGNQVVASPLVTTTYTVIGGGGACSSNSASITITVNPTPSFSLGGNVVLCGNQPFPTLCPSVSKKGDSYSWTGSMPTPPGGIKTRCLPTVNPGTYCLTITNFAGCSTTECVTISIDPRSSYDSEFTLDVECATGSNVTITPNFNPLLAGLSQLIVVDSWNGATWTNIIYMGFSFNLSNVTFIQGETYRIRRRVWGNCFRSKWTTHIASCVAGKRGANSRIGIDDSELEIDKPSIINIYPNPNAGQFNIDLGSNDEIARVEVYDLMGKIVFSESTANSKRTINIQDQPKGIYLVRITIGNEVFNEKVIYQ